ncbi:hypothetical protein Tco_0983140 [Tanacetum coccineum]
MVPRAVLMKSGLVSVNIARQVNAAHSKTTVNAARPMSYLSKIAHLTSKSSSNAVKENNFNVVKASACRVWKLICTDSAKITRKRSKLDKHGHGNG